MTRVEYDRLSRVRRALVGLPGNYQLALMLFDSVLASAADKFHAEDVHHDQQEEMRNADHD